ncbi:hypothetical protein B4102_3184 [Heyndrickxia sporothermodurans]|uniref:Uncharacterized protein n=1 Tax=Heyndrickxia sporothermodurans TaxID=46224 RepID=A0A150KZJ3_9BACI|nr:hypothetical protein B4102_3184 [Heyndrickxia sporothermodurans]
MVLGLHSLALSTKMDLSFGSWASFTRFVDQDGLWNRILAVS